VYNYFYNKVIWTHVAAFADIFNEMSVVNYDRDGKAIGWKPVPVTLAPKEKVVAELIADPSTPDKTPPNFLPRISIVWNGITRNVERQRGQLEKRRITVDYTDLENPQAIMDIQTVPYDMNFELTIWTKYMDDMAQILENILPFFNPEAPVSLYERGIGIERQVKVSLESVAPNFVVELADPDRRVLQCNLGFKMECNFYKPQLPIGKPIKRVTMRMGADVSKRNPVDPNIEGAEISSFLLPSVSGSMDYLDMDKKIWSYKLEFDSNMEEYMGWEHHDNLDPNNPLTGVNPDPTNPNNQPQDSYLYGVPPEEIEKGIENPYNNG
jgi:hypothetical protein